jgi:hypothetical protein
VIPIFIISFNRYTALKKLIDRLTEMKQERIVVIDNQSTYEPLLQYYHQEIGKQFDLILMPKNYGHDVWKIIFKDMTFIMKYRLNLDPFIYTDCDVVPSEECPLDFAQRFNEILARYSSVAKVGFSLRIDDLPDSFEAKQRLIRWESQFWKNKIYDHQIKIDLYPAPIDTTFACCRPNISPGWTRHSVRTGSPYLARHLPWYIDSGNLSEEDRYYIRTAKESETHFPGRYFKEPEV